MDNQLSVVESLRCRIKGEFESKWLHNDPAHREEHFLAVETCALEICKRLGMFFDHKLILLSAYFHDYFAYERHNHHELSALWVLTTDQAIITELSDEDRQLLAIGCREHRASRVEPFTHDFGELMNAADRELPGNIEGMLERALQYRIHRGQTREEAMPDAIAHIKKKFIESETTYPKFYMEAFGDEVEQQKRDLANL